MTINTLFRSEAEYNAAVERTIEIFDATPGTAIFDELELLLVLIKDYEDKHYPIPAPVNIKSVEDKDSINSEQGNLQITIDSETFVLLKDMNALSVIKKLKEEVLKLAAEQR